MTVTSLDPIGQLPELIKPEGLHLTVTRPTPEGTVVRRIHFAAPLYASSPLAADYGRTVAASDPWGYTPDPDGAQTAGEGA